MGGPSRTASPRRRGSASWSHPTLRLVRAPCRVAPRPAPARALSRPAPAGRTCLPTRRTLLRQVPAVGPPSVPRNGLFTSCTPAGAADSPPGPCHRGAAPHRRPALQPPSPGPVLSASLLPWVPPQTDSALLLLSPLPRVYRLGHPSHPAASPAPTWGRLGGCAERPRSLCSQRPLAARSPFLLSSYPRSPQNQANSSARLSPHSHPSPRR